MSNFKAVNSIVSQVLSKRTIAYAECTDCAKQVWIDTNPSPNSIDISGNAVAENCCGPA